MGSIEPIAYFAYCLLIFFKQIRSHSACLCPYCCVHFLHLFLSGHYRFQEACLFAVFVAVETCWFVRNQGFVNFCHCFVPADSDSDFYLSWHCFLRLNNAVDSETTVPKIRSVSPAVRGRWRMSDDGWRMSEVANCHQPSIISHQSSVIKKEPVLPRVQIP